MLRGITPSPRSQALPIVLTFLPTEHATNLQDPNHLSMFRRLPRPGLAHSPLAHGNQHVRLHTVDASLNLLILQLVGLLPAMV